MATIYVRSSDGSDTDNGSTWALAKATLVGAAAIDAAGDTIYLSSTNNSTDSSLSFAGTASNPVSLISVNDSDEPPTVSAVGARVVLGSPANIIGSIYAYGIIFDTSTASGAGYSLQGIQTYESCTIRNNGASSASFSIGGLSSGDCNIKFRDVIVKVTATTTRIEVAHGCFFTWDGGSLESGSLCTTLFGYSGVGNTRGGQVYVSGVDLSAGPTSMNLVNASGNGNASFKFRNCKLPSGWTGLPIQSGSTEPALRVELWNCSAGADNISYWLQEPLCGEVKNNNAVYSGSFGTGTPHSLKFTSAASTNRVTRLVGPDFIEGTGTGSVTVSVEILTDNLTLTNSEVWLEVMAMSDSGSPLGTWVSNKHAEPLATPSAHPTSSVSWTSTGVTTPVKQVLSVSVSPTMSGYLIGRIVLARPSTSVFVEPRLRVV